MRALQGIVSPSTIDSITEDLLKESVALAESTGRPFTIHIAESVLEFQEHGAPGWDYPGSMGGADGGIEREGDSRSCHFHR